MKCDIAIQNIDQYLFGEIPELDAKTSEHLSSCRDCNMHFMAQKKAAGIVKRIADFEPVLNKPAALTDDIMSGLGAPTSVSGTSSGISPFAVFNNFYVRRALSAAAIILFVLFAAEQYIILDKINQLETRVQKVAADKPSGGDIQLYNAWEFHVLRKFNQARNTNKDILKKINALGNTVSVANILPGIPGKYANSPEGLFRELYGQKKFSPLVREYIANFKRRSP